MEDDLTTWVAKELGREAIKIAGARLRAWLDRRGDDDQGTVDDADSNSGTPVPKPRA